MNVFIDQNKYTWSLKEHITVKFQDFTQAIHKNWVPNKLVHKILQTWYAYCITQSPQKCNNHQNFSSSKEVSQN